VERLLLENVGNEFKKGEVEYYTISRALSCFLLFCTALIYTDLYCHVLHGSLLFLACSIYFLLLNVIRREVRLNHGHT
jgi:hypothetical protein